MNVYKQRLDSIVSQLPENAGGALVTSQISRLYLTGLDVDNGFLLVTRQGCALITDFRYIEVARHTLEGVCEAVVYKKLSDTFAELLGRFGASSLLIERERLTIAERQRLAEALEPVELLDSDCLDTVLGSLRISKNTAELGLIRAAQAVTEKAFRRILDFIKEGVSESDLALELEFDMRRRGAQRVAFDLIIAAGANGSKPHAVPGDNRIRQGDFITFDIGAVVGGYHSDMTRTVALGTVTNEQLTVYETVRRAQAAGIEYLMAGGLDCKEADATARSIIEKAGYGDCFGHSLGHGVGMEIHEKPNLSPAATGTIPEGSIVTVEPGIYIEGRFGVRIEDMLYICDGSAIDLTGIEHELIVI